MHWWDLSVQRRDWYSSFNVVSRFFLWKHTHSSEIKPGFNCNDTNRIQYIRITFDEKIQQVQLIRCGFVVCFQCLQVARNAVGMMSSRLRPTKLLRSSDPLPSVDVLHQVGHFLLVSPWKSVQNLVALPSIALLRKFGGYPSLWRRFWSKSGRSCRLPVWRLKR